MLKKFFNPFTALLIVISFAFVFRLSNVLTAPPGSRNVGITMPAAALEESREEPPPLTGNDKEATAEKPASPAGLGVAGSETLKNQEAQKARGLPELPARIFSDSEIEILQSLSKRRDELDRRENELSQKQALLDAAEEEIDRKVNELAAMRKKLEELLGQQQTAQDEQIKSLVKIYENMKPKDAAKIFDTLDVEVLMSVIGKMNERKTSPILASMDPERAKLVTIKLAERRKLPSLEEKTSLPTPETDAKKMP